MAYTYILPQKCVWRDPHGELLQHEPKKGEPICAQLPEDDGTPRHGTVESVVRRDDGNYEITVAWN